ncbi:response regulator [Leptothoe sp. PORK10 BA2]|jgi:DNA-binding response OmpR family regulator|uniref:response regulator n=1 Tax=Leptothoe sp. PORK10 BA2 TaxID=3110254 RepID=UPI002B20220A|nr:response regulator [Leptothoe sp. PORK10 BA2]MEA5464780.1 response regulator [Leptothoe sp. PORK10 BA2]
MKILIVEDDAGLAEVLDQTLSKHHYQVEVAADGQAGWELVELFEYDLVLLVVRQD